MELEVVLPDEEPTMDPATLVELAGLAEELGYRTAWLPDHLLPPGPFGEVYGGVYEPLVTLSYLAARTSAIRLGTSVLVLPMRNAFAVAKQAATVHRLSGERLTLGVGVGWDRAEFATVGADFSTRGARTDEALALLRDLFAGEPSRGVFEPVPRAPLPIMVGGVSGPALRRAARFADEWQAVGVTPAGFARGVSRLRELTGRRIRVTARLDWRGGAAELARAVADVRGFAEVGADAVAVHFGPAEGTRTRLGEFTHALSG
ncbi:TIGR03619 family F420-dependent LLM class oxidoreductase [Prauserella flavalba]|uniref:TIGR03619 family F420-dependent LLM class oxidoreductase n=1 Tax=Prauserella flavalba TaxID=1477506 RepID=UPI0036E3FF8D